jgi:hypothetical protein
MERRQEEVEILAQEFRRSIQGFNKMAEVWIHLAQKHSNDPGMQAYALKTATMYQRMGDEGKKAFESAGGTWPGPGVSFAQHIRSERPDQTADWNAIVDAQLSV